jgi:hypothetical protein
VASTSAPQAYPAACAAVTIGADGSEHLALLKYNAGEADYWPED